MEKQVFKILVATDLSEISEAAVHYAHSLIEPFEARLTLLHVIEPVGGDTVFVAEYDEAIDHALDRLKSLRDELGLEEENCDVKVEVGFPVERILHAVKSDGFSLVVMGMQHDLADLDREIFGSNAYDVVKHGKCAVLTVPQMSTVAAPRKIVLAVSLDAQENIYLLTLVKRLASHYNATITLLHVTKDEHVNIQSSKANAIHWLKEQLKGYDHNFETVTSSNIPEAIHFYVEDHPTDMLIMSPETQGFLVRLFQGSNTRKTLMHSEIPLLTFPMDYA